MGVLESAYIAYAGNRRRPVAIIEVINCFDDTVQHTLEECPVWVMQRRDFFAAVVAAGNLQILVVV